MKLWASRSKRGFTIVELLIVIVVIAILAAITIVAYNGIQARAKSAQLQAALTNVYRKIEAYNAENGSYPATQSGTLVNGLTNAMTYVDGNCTVASSASVTKTNAWVPGVDMTLPQSAGQKGARGSLGCFMYQSDGKKYLLSAWNVVENGPQNSTLYRRVGFRETSNGDMYYLCNHINIGGSHTGSYVTTNDYYKYSYTFSNISNCDETPPAGA